MPSKDTSIRKKTIALAVALVVVCVASLCVSSSTYEVYGLGTAFHAIQVWVQTGIATVFGGEHFTTVDLVHMEPNVYQVRARIGITLTSLVCGIILTVSGSIYQAVFRNPIAAPTMLGVSSGLNVGLVIFVLVYGTAATSSQAALPHYLFAYGGAVLVLALVLGTSFLLNGPKRFNVVDMLLIGSVISLMLSQIVLYVSYQVFDESLWLTYTTLNEVLDVDNSLTAYAFLGTAFLLTIIPVFLLRFRFNALSFTDEETYGLGINGTRLRYLGIFVATIMVIAALAHSGMVGMVSLIVPFASRAYFGAEFRKQLLGNVLMGALLLVVCRTIAGLLSIVLFNMGLTFNFPVGIVASLICMPAFVWIVATRQKAWND